MPLGVVDIRDRSSRLIKGQKRGGGEVSQPNPRHCDGNDGGIKYLQDTLDNP